MLPFWSYKSKLLTPNRQHPRAFFQKAAILFKAINRNNPFNGSAMNSPPTPPYCGSVAAALHLMNSQIRCGSCREKVLFIALRWMQPDRGMMWQAENSELAREFPAGTASKARQSRLHQTQGVFPGFVVHSFVQFLNNSCSKNKNFSPLMSINCPLIVSLIVPLILFNSCSICVQFVNNSRSKTN